MSKVRIVPLGGLGEIGLNMMVMETGGESIVIDCGLMFPEPHMPGIDIVIPDFQYLMESEKELKGVVLTHGHEDHIGALPFFFRHFNPPVYGTSLTLGLLERKLKEHKLDDKVELVEAKHGEAVDVGPFSVEFIRVCHSIPDGSALAIRTPAGTVLHSGDFKFDDTPIDLKNTDCDRLSYYGDKGVLALMSDSTNVELEGNTESEKTIEGSFDRAFRDTKGKVVIALFSSNINRIQQIIGAAEKHGRKIALVGRSLVSNIPVARERGFLRIPEDTIIGVKEMGGYNPRELAVITTGSQGEPMSGLSLMATRSHKYVSIDEGDRVILSSKSIPGNEKLVCNIINQLLGLGADVLYDRVANVHVSGHGYREELKKMIYLTKPRYFIPIHGERRHLVHHIKLAQESGITGNRTLLAENGDTVILDEEGIKIGEKAYTGRVFVDGKGVGDVRDLVLRDRLHLSKDGMVVAVVAVDHLSGEMISDIEMFSKGFIHGDEESLILEEAKKAVNAYLAEARSDLKTDWAEMEAEIGKALKRFFKKKVARRPVIIPVVMEM